MSSENPSGADNQQERPSSRAWLNEVDRDLGHWIAGFIDGEGSFNVPIRRERDRGLPFRVGLSFNVSQRGEQLPELLRSTFGVGRTRSRRDGVWYFEVTKPDDLDRRVIPFFERFPLRGSKAGDLEEFKTVLELVQTGAHLSVVGLERIMTIRNGMNNGGKRRRSDKQIRSVLRAWESSEAIRKAP